MSQTSTSGEDRRHAANARSGRESAPGGRAGSSSPPRIQCPVEGRIVDEGECAPGRVLNRDHKAHAVRPASGEWLVGVFEGDRVHVAAVLVGTYFHHPALDRAMWYGLA